LVVLQVVLILIGTKNPINKSFGLSQSLQ